MAESYADSGDKAALFRRLKKQFQADREFSAAWRKEAKEDFDFVAGEQLSEDDKKHLIDAVRPVIQMNLTQPIINAISGQEMGNRQEVRFIPREEGDVKPNEMLTEGARWFRDSASGEDVDSEAFVHTLICGMGWTDTTLNFEEDEAGEPEMAPPLALEMFWDRSARQHNLVDAERVWRVRKLRRGKVREMFPDAAPGEMDATWARGDEDEGAVKNQDRERLYLDDNGDPSLDDDDEVTIVHCQYIVKEPVWDVLSPLTGEVSEMSDKDYRTYAKRAQDFGLPVKATRKTKRRYKDCWLGNAVLATHDAICQTRFRYQCITAYKDYTKGTFYGCVRGMKDPQRWANKWMLQVIDLMNSQAKGGVMIEEGALAGGVRDFEKTWARADKPTVVLDGTLSNPTGPRIQPKPSGQFPQGFYQMMTFAFDMVRSVSGISPELLGQADRDQPASLEYQRRQAGMIILQPLFKNLKRYRQENGHVVLYILQNHLSDGRLIRIVGEENEQYVPLVKQADVKYDIIVDDAPTSPNQKEMVWAMIGERFWELPPDIQLAFLPFSPFPSTVVEKVQKAADKQAESPAAQAQEKLVQATAMLEEAKVMLTQAQAAKAAAEAQKVAAEQTADPNADLAIKEAEARGKLMLKQQEIAANVQMKREEQAGDMAMRREEMAFDQQMRASQQAQDQALQARNAEQDMALRARTADADLAMRDKASAADIARKDQQAKAAAKRQPQGAPAR